MSDRRVPRPAAVLSFLAAIALGAYFAGLMAPEALAAWFGFLAVMALDSIAGSLDRMAADRAPAPQRWTTGTLAEFEGQRRFDA